MSNTSTLATTTVKGTLWNYSTFVASKGIIFLSTIILARILGPDDFGLLALGLLAIDFLDTFSDFGVGAALIYRQNDPDHTANVAFVLSITMGALLTAVSFFGAPLVAAFFNEPRVTPIMQVLALGFLLSGLRNIHESRLKKGLDFRRRFVPEVGKTLTKGGVSVGLALTGCGVWSLVWGQLIGGATSTLLYWRVTRWRPVPTFDLKIARALCGYGMQIVLLSFLAMIHKNIDQVFIGWRLDVMQLGFYTMAFRLPELIIINICYVASQTLFPAYAKLQSDPAALRTGFLTTLRYLSLITVPCGIGLCLVTPEFVQVFYTTRWAPAIPVMQVLTLCAVIYSLIFPVGDVYKASGRVAMLNQLNLVEFLLTIPVFWVAAGHNIFYVALGRTGVTMVCTLLSLGIVSRILAIRPTALVVALKPAACGACVMLLGMLALRAHVLQYGPGVRLLLLTLAGLLLYGATLWCTSRSLLQQAATLLWPTGRSLSMDNTPD